MKSGQGPQQLNRALPVPLKVFHGDRKSQHLRQMTSCGTAMPWDCADYSNSLNKHGPINHSPTLSNLAHNSAAHLLYCRAGCVCAFVYVCAHVCFYIEAHACICISTSNICSVYLNVYASSFPFCQCISIYFQKEASAHHPADFDSKLVSTE